MRGTHVIGENGQSADAHPAESGGNGDDPLQHVHRAGRAVALYHHPLFRQLLRYFAVFFILFFDFLLILLISKIETKLQEKGEDA